jgi:hypothetical protein
MDLTLVDVRKQSSTLKTPYWEGFMKTFALVALREYTIPHSMKNSAWSLVTEKTSLGWDRETVLFAPSLPTTPNPVLNSIVIFITYIIKVEKHHVR